MDAYLRQRINNTGINGSAVVAAADSGTVTLVTGKAGWTIYVQRLFVVIITDAAQTLTFKDTAGTPVQVEATDASPSANAEYMWDFTSRGKPLTEAKNFVAAISSAGLAAHIEWEGYMKQTGTEYVAGISSSSQGSTGQNFA
jgi:pyruvate/2-oxoglutarate dehydrogenase complex dihydrolipoamide acyltransferase (E2) component